MKINKVKVKNFTFYYFTFFNLVKVLEIIVIKFSLLYNNRDLEVVMEDKLTKEEVMHVLDLARLDASPMEIEKYQYELKKMLNEIDKIKDLNDFDEELLIAPWNQDTILRNNDDLTIENGDILLNVPNKKGNFISVDVEVLKDE